MAGAGYIADRGLRGLVHNDKVLKMAGASWLEPTGAAVFFDDFLGDTLNTDFWAEAVEGTGNTAFAISTTAGDPVAGHGGWIAGACGSAAAGNNTELAGELQWRADRAGNGLLVFETRVSLPAITNITVIAGLSDAKSETGQAFAIGAADAITSTATDAAVWILDTGAGTDNWFGLNVDSDSDGALTPSGGIAPTATTATRLRIEIDSAGVCYYYFTDVATAGPTFRGSDATGVSPDVLLCPYLSVASDSSAASRELEVDYVLVACAR